MEERIAPLTDPRSLGKALRGAPFPALWRYRTGDYRLVCGIQDAAHVILVVRIGPRKDIDR